MPTVDAHPLESRQPHRRALLCALAGLLAVATILLYCFPPESSGFYPRCLLHQLTGLSCPGCGATRALHHLLHGRWIAALRSNLIIVAVLPWMMIWGIRMFTQLMLNRRPPAFPFQMGTVIVVVSLFLLFGVFRNLPFDLCRWCLPP